MLRVRLSKQWPWFTVRHTFRPPRLSRVLPPEALAPVSLCASPALVGGPLASIWRESGDSQKWAHYFPLYEEHLHRFIGTAPRFLEIGVDGGGSLTMWRRYFGAHATIVGIDIEPRCARLDDPGNSVFVRIGSQANPAFLRSIVSEFGPFDAILDDGSHIISDMVASFAHLFVDGLALGGVYLVEDTHATYWTRHRDRPMSFADFCRDLIDLKHAAYWSLSRSAYFRGAPVTVPRLSALIDRIVVHDSITAIYRATEAPAAPQLVRATPSAIR